MATSLAAERADAYIDAQSKLEARLADPLSCFRWAVPRLGKAFGMFTDGSGIHELHARGPNKTGKTYCKAAWMLACLQKRESLGGIRIPQWRGPVEGVQLVLDYPQQLLSVKKAYKKLLGRWPHRIRNNGDYIASIHVMPVGGDPEDQSDWSKLYFGSQKNPDTGRGWRADLVDIDEPPDMEVLRELRKAADAGRICRRVIGETPEKRSEWFELSNDYGETPRRSIRRIDRLRAEVRWSVSAFPGPDKHGRWDDEVADWLLSPQEKQDMWDAYQKDPLFGADGGARWHGDYMNTAGSSPWGKIATQALLEMMKECRDPLRPDLECRIQRDTDDDVAVIDRVRVQVWKKPVPGKGYYIPIDPSSGVDDGKHNPAGLHVREVGTGDLCARWNGYLSPYSLGVLAAGLAVRYNGAEIDVETNDHWGPTVVLGITSINGGNYWNLGHQNRLLSPGQWSKEIGFRADKESRAGIVGQVQEWLEAYAAGIKYALTPSADVLKSILDCELDDRGLIVAIPGVNHGEDVICQGKSLEKAVTRSGRMGEDLYAEPKSAEARVMAKVMALDEEPDELMAIPRAVSRGAV